MTTSKTFGVRLKDLYVESTVGTWVKELNALLKLKGARKVGENPDDWMRRVISRIRSEKENLGELSFDILGGYIMSVDLGDDITATTTESYRQTKWPSLETLRRSISEEYQSKLNAGKTKPTASERPSNEDPKLNLTQTSRKRKRQTSESSEKRHETDEKRKGADWPACPKCNQKHPVKIDGQCYYANPELAPTGWKERNKDRIEAFKKSKSK